MHKLNLIINEIMPEAIRPVFFNVAITTVDVEFYVKMASLALSSAYLVYKWHNDIKKNK